MSELLFKVDQKPEGLEDSFFDSATGEIKVGALINSFKETKTKFSSREEDIRAGMETERFQNRPKDPAGYSFGLPEGFETPNNVTITPNDAHPLVGWFRKFAWENGLDQAGFDEGVKTYFEGEMAQLPDYDTEVGLLGERGKERAARVNDWLKSVVTDEAQFKNIESLVTNAVGIQAFEAILDKAGAPAMMGDGGNAPKTTLEPKNDFKNNPTEYQAETDRLMSLPEYAAGREDVHKQVSDRFKAANPGTVDLSGNTNNGAPDAATGPGSDDSAGAGDQ